MLTAGGAEVNLQKGDRGTSTAGGVSLPTAGLGEVARGKGAGPPLGEGSMVTQRGRVGRLAHSRRGSGETHKGVLGPPEGLQLLRGQRLELGQVAATCIREDPEGLGARNCSCPGQRHNHQHQQAAHSHSCDTEGQKGEGSGSIRR